MPTITTHNDEAVLDCLLERKEFRARIREQILNAKPPKAIAIHGTWGTGKTSMLKQLYRELGGKYALSKEDKACHLKPLGKRTINKVKPVWFEAWQYQHEPNILAAMLKEIRDQLSWIAKTNNEIKDDAVITALSVLQSIDVSFKAFGTGFGVKGLVKNVKDNIAFRENETISGPLDSVKMKKLLKEAIDQLLGLDKIFTGVFKITRDRKVIIFIDDLDRCEPETVFRILESIKVYLNLENCVFVLGMDMKAVEESVLHKYEKLLKQSDPEDKKMLKNKARLYLEKICQDVYLLPIPSQEKRTGYFRALIESKGEGLPEGVIDRMIALCREFRILPPFPRSIKILANVFLAHYNNGRIQKMIYGSEQADRNLKLFVMLAYLYSFHFELYQLVFLYDDGEENFYRKVLYPFCKDPNNESGEVSFHPILKNLTTPTGSAQMRGDDGNPYIGEASVFPHESFRQVFWVQALIKNIAKLETEDYETLQKLKF